MPQITNTFLKSKMNKDLDARILPNGEYRDAQNLQISRSEGSEVGEFENILGNERLKYLYTGRNFSSYTGKIIGQFTDPPTGSIYIFSAGYLGAERCPRDIVVYADPAGATGTVIELFDAAGNLLNPIVLGIELGMLLWGVNWNGQPSGAGGQEVDPIVSNVTTTNITISQTVTLAASDEINIGYANTIHRYDVNNDTLTLLVRGSFLNFHKDFRMYGVNLIQNLLFWTDNRNQPRRINVDLANPLDLIEPIHYVNEDQISVAQYYPYKVPLVLKEVLQECTAGAQSTTVRAGAKGYDLTVSDITGIKISDIATGFPDQEDQELWNVIDIIPGAAPAGIVVIYNNFKDGNSVANMQPGTWNGTTNVDITFSNTTMSNEFERKLARGFDASAQIVTATPPFTALPIGTYLPYTDFQFSYAYNNLAANPSQQPTPRVGDYITAEPGQAEVTGSGTTAITIEDEVTIQQITAITPGARIVVQLTKSIDTLVDGAKFTISANPTYNKDFTGDPDLIEEKFVRFSYRFKYENNEYSLAAPYTQICFIPKHDGYFGGGKNDSLQDQVNAYDSSIVEWFTNKIDNISLKIPLPDITPYSNSTEVVEGLINDYKVKNIEILYKETDALSTKILESIEINSGITSALEIIPSGNIKVGDEIWFYNFDYKSIKPYRTFPTTEQNRAWDNVPLKALGQEITGNRVIYGNFLQKHTPPTSLDYEVINGDKSLKYNNYAQYPNHSVKQNRNYQVGWVFADRYGRASSVVLSSNDDNPAVNGSTIYMPYKTWPEVDDPINDLTTYKWLGNSLRVKLNNGITQLTNNSITGEPGLYKSEDDTSVDSVVIVSGGLGHAVGDIVSFSYQVGTRGLGSGLTAEVISETGGVITGIQIVTRGSGYVEGQQLFQSGTTGAGTGAVITVTVYPANPTGWESYKLVVKQQEQDYYNIYLPGYVSGYPVDSAIDYGRVSFAVLLGDNINKVPRDLNEVGPLQTEFSATVKLFGRVNNPNINNKGVPGDYYSIRPYAWNTQYFPGRINDEAVTVGPVGLGGLELANSPFDDTAAKGAFDNSASGVPPGPFIPWGDAGSYQSFYNVEQNPLAMGLKIGSEESQPQLTAADLTISSGLNTLGAKVSNNIIGDTAVICMYPYLSVSETEAVESQLEIFYESSTTGNIIDLNRQVVADYEGVTAVTAKLGSFDESDVVGTDIITAFNFTDSAGNKLTLDELPIITQVIDSNGVNVTGIFEISETIPAAFDDFDISTNQLFWYGAETESKSNTWQVSFQTKYTFGGETFIDNLNNVTTINLTNMPPTIAGFTPAYGTDAGVQQACGAIGGSSGYIITDTGVWGQFTGGVNGSADVVNNTQELCYELSVLSAPVGSTSTFTIDQTGVLTQTGGTIVNGDYEFECTLTDAASSCVLSPGSLSDTCVYKLIVGIPPVDQALCFGPTIAMSSLQTDCKIGTGEPLEVFFGVNQFINSGIAGTVVGPPASIGSGTNTLLSQIDIAASLGSLGYGINSNNGLDIQYYNVLGEALAINPCAPAPAPGFTTGALTQGVLAIDVKLTKTAFASPDNEYKTNFTILYRATAADPWQLAVPEAGSPTSPGVSVGNFNPLSVSGVGGTTANQLYYFNTIGEYAIRNNGVYDIGCTACTSCARFHVDFYDATFGPGQTGCAGADPCTGPL